MFLIFIFANKLQLKVYRDLKYFKRIMGFMLYLCWLLTLSVLVGAQFHQTPQPEVVILGETVTLRCSIAHSPGLFTYWLKGTGHISRGRQILGGIGSEYERRYSIVGNDLDGEYFLKISDVKVEDAGEYRCAFISLTSGLTSQPATLTVIVPPKTDFPVCLSTPVPGAHKPGSTVEMNCISLGGIPRANLTWTRNAVQLGNVTFDNNKITRVLTPNDNGVSFTCTATSPALRKPRLCTIMPMKIPPTPKIMGSTNSSFVGDNFTASCHSDGIPAIGSYSWFMDGNLINNANPRFFAINHHIKIHNLEKNDNNAILTCMVITTLGLTGNYSILIKVEQPTTTEVTTTIAQTTTQKAVPTTNTYLVIDDENDIDSGVKNKEHSNTGVTRYNMKLILALIFGMLIFIFIIVLMTLTYFFASHTTRSRKKECGYEDTTLGPIYRTVDPIIERLSTSRDFPLYPQTYVSQEIPLSPDDPMMLELADTNSIIPDNSTENKYFMKDSQEQLTDEQKIECRQAEVDSIENTGLNVDVTKDQDIENDTSPEQQISIMMNSSGTVSEPLPEANDDQCILSEHVADKQTRDMVTNVKGIDGDSKEYKNKVGTDLEIKNDVEDVTSDDIEEIKNEPNFIPHSTDENYNHNSISASDLAEEID